MTRSEPSCRPRAGLDGPRPPAIAIGSPASAPGPSASPARPVATDPSAASWRAAAASAALERLPDGVLVVCDGEVVLANHAFARLTGSDPTGSPAPDWLPTSSADRSRSIVVDLDHFKAVNDVRGHPTGDRVLAEAAARIAGAARAVDTVGRIGGEEFAWPLPEDAAAAALTEIDACAGTQLNPRAGTLLRAALAWLAHL